MFCQKVYKQFSTNRRDSPQVTTHGSPQAINYSMIFRTINADAKKLTEQFGLLNKSFRDIKKDFANGLGFKNSLFQTSISKTDYQALQKFNSAIKVTNDGLTKSQRITKAWNENMSGCSIAAKRMGNDLVTGKKNIQDISKAMNTASGSTKALGIAMNVMANVGFMLAITAITKVISELAQAQDNAVQAAKEATETYKSELDSIADYKQRLSELHEELKSGNLSYEETKTKRTELMTIQDELIERFGTEKGAIESVTDAVKGQVDALDDLNEKAYRDWVAKADAQTFWNKLLPGGKSGLDQAIDYMATEKTVSFMDMQNANLSDDLQEIQKEIDETIRAKYNLDKTFAMFNVTGTPDEIRTQLENILQDYADISKEIFTSKGIDWNLWEEYRKETTDSINEAINSLDKGLEKHQDTYKTYIEGLIKYDSEYSDEYANILQKRAELESAQNSGNEEEIKRAKQEFMDSINDAIIASDSDESIKKYFESLYPELQAEFDNWAFEFDLEVNKDGIADVAKEIGKKYTATDLLGMIDDESATIADSAFNSLIDKAIEYGICTDKSAEEVQKLIDLLVELGIVQDNVKSDTFNDKNPISFTSFTEAQLQSIDNFQSKVKTLSDTLSSLNDGSFTHSSLVDLLQEFPELTGKTDDLQGAIQELIHTLLEDLYSALGENVPTALRESLQSIADEANNAALNIKSIPNAISDLQSIHDLIQTVSKEVSDGGISATTLQNIAGKYSQLEDAVNAYCAGLLTEQELYARLQEQYNADYEAFQVANRSKMYENELFFEMSYGKNSELVNELARKYELDLKNFKTVEAAKLAGEKKLLGDMAGIWSKYYSIVLDKDGLYKVEGTAFSETYDAQNSSEYMELEEKRREIQSFLDDLNESFKLDNILTLDYTPGSLSGSSSSAKETKEFSEELNWTEKLINRVSSALGKLKDKVTNTYIGWSVRNHSLSKAMEKTNEAINAQRQAYEQYMQKAASVGLSQEYVNKIQNGSLDIETITDESLADQIKEYETWYDKASDCSDAIEELKTQLAELAKQKFDNINTYFRGLMDTTEKSISRLEIKEKNTFKAPNAGVYNSLYDETQNLINYNTQRVQQLEDALVSAVNSGYIESGSEAWRDMYNEILDVRNATEEYKLELQDISKRSYEALLKPIEQELAKLEQRKNVIENMQDRLALQGYVAAKGLYERQLRDSESRLKTLKEQATQLQRNMQDAVSKGLEVGSDDWVDMKSAIDDNVISVMGLENSIIELRSAIRDLEWDKFDRFQNSISRITDESDFMIDMFSKEDAYGEDGKLTAEGSAVIGLHAQNYFAYREQARAYKDEVDKINKELENGSANSTLIDRKNDLIDAYQNAAKAAHDEYEAVIELGKDGYQAQIDSIQELIDAKKKQLETDKSLYEYQKNIAEKTKNIADIQKQLSALSNDDSEENRAKIQKLKADLTDAQKDLEDTQYDKWYNDQQDMLDRLAEEYAALISEQSQNEQEVFQEMIGYVNSNAQDIQNTISSTAQEWDYVLNHGIDSVLEPGISGMTDIGQNIYREILRLYELNERMYRVSADLADLGVTDYGLETTISDETTARNFIERLYNGLLDRHSEEDGLNYWMNKLMNGESVQEMLEGFLNSDEYKAMGKSVSDTIIDFYEGLLGRSGEAFEYQYWMDKYNSGMSLSEIGTHGFLYSDEFLSRDQWMRMLDAQPTNVDYTAFAKRGLIPMNTNSFINTGFMPQISVPDYPKLPNVTSSGNTSFGDININIPIEHVADYNDFVTQIQRDGKFEKMIQDMTIGQLAGKSSLVKNSYRWT